jgi:imidazolonepropionase-like amidohydrolase
MSKLRIFTLVGILAASTTAALRADDDDIQVPNVLNAPPASAVIRYDQPVIAVAHVRVVDGTGAPARADQTVVIDHGKIRAVGPAASVVVPGGATTIDGTGHTLTPGFVGTHDHLYFVSGGPLFITREMPFSFPRLYLGAGVTTIRTAGSLEPYTDLHIAEAIRRGELVGPHMDVTSVYLTGWEPFFVQMGALRDPADAKRTVNFWADHGVTSFKLYTSLPPDIARAAIAAAHARHLKVVAHLCSIGFTEAARMGVDSLEHGLMIDTEFMPNRKPGVCPSDANAVRQSIAALDIDGPKVKALIREMIAHHVALSSTLANFEGALPQPDAVAQRMFDLEDAETVADVKQVRDFLAKRPAAEAAARKAVFDKERAFEIAFLHAGGLLTQGPDPTGYGSTIAGLGDQRDMELMVEAGLTPLEAIRVATLNGAISLGRERTIGTIAAGKNADLVLIKGDPSTNIADVEQVETVFKDGVGYDSGKLIASVRGHVGRQ